MAKKRKKKKASAIPADIRVDEVVPEARPLHLAIALACALLAYAGLQLAARSILDRFTTNRGYWVIGEKWRMVESLGSPLDWMILGDSSCNQAVQAKLLEERLGGSVRNFCTIGDMLVVDDAWMLERHIARVGPPKHVVLVHVYDVWPRHLSEARKQLLLRAPLPWREWERLDPPLSISPEDRRKLALTRFLPLYSENTTLADWALHPSKPFRSGFALDDRGYMRNEVTNPKDVDKDVRSHLSYIKARKGRVSLHKDNVAALGAIVRLANEHGFDVTIAYGPLADTMADDEDVIVYLSALNDAIHAAVDRDPRVRFVLTPPPSFPVAQMENADHVVHDAATVYSEALAKALAR
jgi:hypothetical protein